PIVNADTIFWTSRGLRTKNFSKRPENQIRSAARLLHNTSDLCRTVETTAGGGKRGMRTFARIIFGAALIVLLPMVASAQTSAIAGTVKDTSGAVLPGVTVEASSPALIEKVRSAVTDSNGQFKIEALRPGTYTVTFTLPGFSVVKRENVELT